MRGSIRVAVGFLLAFGSVGGLDAGSNLYLCVAMAFAGLAIMASGVSAMQPRV